MKKKLYRILYLINLILLIIFVFVIVIDVISFVPSFFSKNLEVKFIAKKELRETGITFLVVCMLALYLNYLRRKMNKDY